MEQDRNAQKTKRTQKDYSLAFKVQLVDEVEKGSLHSSMGSTFFSGVNLLKMAYPPITISTPPSRIYK